MKNGFIRFRGYDQLMTANLIKSILESHEIKVIVKQENLSSLFGEIPFAEDCKIELWIPAGQEERAREVLKSSEESTVPLEGSGVKDFITLIGVLTMLGLFMMFYYFSYN